MLPDVVEVDHVDLSLNRLKRFLDELFQDTLVDGVKYAECRAVRKVTSAESRDLTT